MLVLLYIPLTFILSAIDAWRIRRTWGKVGNINHWLSYLLCVVTIAALYFIVKPSGWHIVAFVAECALMRAVFFDGFLNLCRREKIDYVSNASNSFNEDRLTKVGFWVRRLIAVIALAIVFIVDNIFI